MIDVTALGELLIDFTPCGRSEAGQNLFEQNPGGAPANVLTAVSRLGGSTAFMGKVGNDLHAVSDQREAALGVDKLNAQIVHFGCRYVLCKRHRTAPFAMLLCSCLPCACRRLRGQ